MTTSPFPVLQAIALCFEKSEMLDGWTHRWCPFPSETAAAGTFDEWVEELGRLKGPPRRSEIGNGRRAEWRDLRVKQAGRGIVIWLGAVEVYRYWEQDGLWDADPVGDAFEWGPDDRGYRPAGWREGD